MSDSIEGFILAGGRSSRMGVPKPELVIGGVSFLERAANALSVISSGGVIVIGSAGGDKLRSIPDVEIENAGQPSGGALVGLYTALLAAESDWIAVLACDMPFVTGELFTGLAAIDRTGMDALIPLDFDGRSQPLCALYRREPCLAAVQRCFVDGDTSLRAMLSHVKTRSVLPSELPQPLLPHSFLNVNTRTDLKRANYLSDPVI